MVWIRLLENGAPVPGVTEETLEFSSPPAVGDRIIVYRQEGGMTVFEVVARSFDIVVDEHGSMMSDERVTLDVERLEFVADEDLTSGQRH